MQFDFKGKKVVVCGGSRGIGRSIAEAFVRDGAAVAICARGKDGLDKAAAELGRGGAKVYAGVCDLADGTAVKAYVKAAGESLGGIDVLVNNASGFGHRDDEAGWAAGLNIDLMATVRASHAAIPFMEKAGGGSIINISSISGFGASVRSAPYAAVKAAVNNYTSSQALTLAPKRIRVNAIAPGSIEFPGGVWDQRKTSDPALYNGTLKSIPWGRMGKPEEIASVAVFLASDLAAWVTGQTIMVDGGQML
ncbi:MAG: SDR family NAD(P)-dependent oxidoreductase [Hyphomicrobiaceae bacterium]|nr:SDR family NAD(P)-dependent oxidoreductase [Hyphomicrobiaceae bacterium]